MADTELDKKISALPEVTEDSLVDADKFPVVASGVTSFIKSQRLANWIQAKLGSLSLDVGLSLQKALSTQGSLNRLSIQATDQSPTGTGNAEVQIIPSPAVDQSGLTSQIILYGKTGDDYERFAITNFNHDLIIDSTANHDGPIRNVTFQMGGYVEYAATGKQRAGRNALTLVSDASVRLRGSTEVIAEDVNEAGGTFGAERTSIYDFGNTGDSRLLIATHPDGTDDAGDVALLQFLRGNITKWHVGLNAGGSNADSFDFYAGGVNRMQLEQDGDLHVSGNVYAAGVLLGSGGGGATSPGGVDTQVQYNNGGAFGGAANLLYNDATGNIGVGVAGAADTLLTVQADRALEKIAFFNNTSATGFGVRFQTGDNTKYALKASDSADAGYFQVFGKRIIQFGAETSGQLTRTLADTNNNTFLMIEGDSTYVQPGILLTDGFARPNGSLVTSMIYMSGGDWGLRYHYNYREPYVGGSSFSDTSLPQVMFGIEQNGAASFAHFKAPDDPAGSFDAAGGKSLIFFVGGYNAANSARTEYVMQAVGNPKRGIDFAVEDSTTDAPAGSYSTRLRIKSTAADATNPVWIWVGGSLRQVTVDGSGFLKAV